MENNSVVSDFLDQLIQKQIAFASWFNPKESQLGLIIGDASDVLFFDRFDRLNGEAGFVFAPYRITGESPVILLKPKVYFEDFTCTERFIDSPSQKFIELLVVMIGSKGLGNFIVLISFE